MKTEKTITICGKEVKLLYCAATESGYEQLAGQSINDLDFKKQSDLLKLALAAIISAYSRDKQEPPITDSDLLYNAEPKDEVFANLKKNIKILALTLALVLLVLCMVCIDASNCNLVQW